MRKAVAKALTWRLIGTAEIFAISFWTTGHLSTAGRTAGLVAITSIILYVAHEFAWQEGCEFLWSGGSDRSEAGIAFGGEPLRIAASRTAAIPSA